MRLWVLAGALLAASPAMALDPYMWGVGPRLGTNILPGQQPFVFPSVVRDETAISKVKNDVTFGAEALYYVNGRSRAGMLAGLGVGDHGYFNAHFMVNYDIVLQQGAMDFLAGGAAGVGSTTYKGVDEERLVVPNYPIRGQLTGLLRDGTRGYQGRLYGQWEIPGRASLTRADGTTADLSAGQRLGALYLTFGVELSVMFGDFEPPKPKKRD